MNAPRSVAAVLLAVASFGCGRTPSLVEIPDPPERIEGADAAPGKADVEPALPVCEVALSTDRLTVATTNGLVRGTTSGDGLKFLGIPYAQPPVGPLRFERPLPAACFSGVREATDFGPSCAQLDLLTETLTGSEDCLSLNVWTPSPSGITASSSPKKPVMVFFHGGGDVIGASNQRVIAGNLYDGSRLARDQDVVVVTFNYRLGVLGFLSHPKLSETNAQRASGNYGLFDAILALKWVKANAERFGGDPNKVMLFGESAGAFNTCALVASPLAKGLFASALMESGNCEAPTLEMRADLGSAVVKTVQCEGVPDVATCLKNAPLAKLVAAGGSLLEMVPGNAELNPRSLAQIPYGPTVDGYLLPKAPVQMLKEGTHNHVPLVMGTNRDEFALFALIPNTVPTTCVAYRQRIAAHFGPLSEKVLELYPCSQLNPVTGGHDAYVKVVSAAFFTCPTRRAAAYAAASQTEPVYRYLFTHRYDYGPYFALGAFHIGELPFVFDTFPALGYLPTFSEGGLLERMQARWSGLARSGVPDGAEGLSWPRYNSVSDNALALDTAEGMVNAFDKAGCDFWDEAK